MSLIEYQRVILADSVRNTAFVRALKKVVSPGCAVLDIGSGTGFLAFLVKKMGAGHCMLIERNEEYLRLSREVAKRNDIRGCTFIEGHSTETHESIVADVIVSETLGNFAYEENIIETLRDARRFLRPGGVMLPQSIVQHVVPVTDERYFNEVTSWDRVGHGIDFHPARERSINNVYVRAVKPQDIFEWPHSIRSWDTVDLCASRNSSTRRGEVEWNIDAPTIFFGFCVFWECKVFPGITISTSPGEPLTHWQQIYLPVRMPLQMEAGESLHLSITSDSRLSIKINVEWAYERRGKNGKVIESQKLDMRHG